MNNKKIKKLINEKISKKERAFITGATLGVGIMTGYIIFRSIKRTAKREARINEVADNIEVIIDVITERFLEKRGMRYGKETE